MLLGSLWLVRNCEKELGGGHQYHGAEGGGEACEPAGPRDPACGSQAPASPASVLLEPQRKQQPMVSRSLPAPAVHHSLPGAPSRGPADLPPSALCLLVLPAALVPSETCPSFCSHSPTPRPCCKHSFVSNQSLLSPLPNLPSESSSLPISCPTFPSLCRKPLGGTQVHEFGNPVFPILVIPLCLRGGPPTYLFH